MNLGGPELLIILLFGVVPFALFMVALVDALGYDDSTWRAADQNKVLWVLLIVFLGCLGPILYLTMTKPKLRTARSTR